MSKKGGPPSLSRAPIDLLRLQHKQRSKLLDILDEFGGTKDLFLDPSLAPLLDLFVEIEVLREHGVKSLEVLVSLNSSTTNGNNNAQPPPVRISDIPQAIFLIHVSHLDLLSHVAAQIRHDEQLEFERSFVVVFIPRITSEGIERLKREEVFANVTIREFPLHIVACDNDILSMQMPNAYADIHLHGILSPAYYAALALVDLQNLYGIIPRVDAMGSAAKHCCDIMLRLMSENDDGAEPVGEKNHLDDVVVPLSQRGIPRMVPPPKESSKAMVSPIDKLVVFDRRVDLYSVLCSPFTYEALLDQHFDINGTKLIVGLDVIPSPTGKATELRLNDDDPLYNEIRDLHIAVLGPLLHQKANMIQETYQEKDNLKSIQEITNYMAKFKVVQAEHTSLTTHVNLASYVSTLTQSEEMREDLACEDEITASNKNSLQHIEDMIDAGRPIHEVLRLLCLYCTINQAMTPKMYDQIKRGILQVYGYEHLLTLSHLEKGGFLPQRRQSDWTQIRRQFDLLVDDREVADDISYAYAGYAPLSVRLVQLLQTQPRGWESIKNTLNLLWGPEWKIEMPAPKRENKEYEVVLVFFIGGVTRAEIAALRKLEKMEEGRRRFLIATTEFWTSKKAFHQMSHKLTAQDEALLQPKEKEKEAPKATEKRGWWR